MIERMWVRPHVVDAAKLKVKLARRRGLPIDPATEAIANARQVRRAPGSSDAEQSAPEDDQG